MKWMLELCLKLEKEEKWNVVSFCPTLINWAIRKVIVETPKLTAKKEKKLGKFNWPKDWFFVLKKTNEACTVLLQFAKLPFETLLLTSDVKFVCEQLKLAASSEVEHFSHSLKFPPRHAQSFFRSHKAFWEIFKIFRLVTLVRLLACCGVYFVTFTSSRLTTFLETMEIRFDTTRH